MLTALMRRTVAVGLRTSTLAPASRLYSKAKNKEVPEAKREGDQEDNTVPTTEPLPPQEEKAQKSDYFDISSITPAEDLSPAECLTDIRSIRVYENITVCSPVIAINSIEHTATKIADGIEGHTLSVKQQFLQQYPLVTSPNPFGSPFIINQRQAQTLSHTAREDLAATEKVFQVIQDNIAGHEAHKLSKLREKNEKRKEAERQAEERSRLKKLEKVAAIGELGVGPVKIPTIKPRETIDITIEDFTPPPPPPPPSPVQPSGSTTDASGKEMKPSSLINIKGPILTKRDLVREAKTIDTISLSKEFFARSKVANWKNVLSKVDPNDIFWRCSLWKALGCNILSDFHSIKAVLTTQSRYVAALCYSTESTKSKERVGEILEAAMDTKGVCIPTHPDAVRRRPFFDFYADQPAPKEHEIETPVQLLGVPRFFFERFGLTNSNVALFAPRLHTGSDPLRIYTKYLEQPFEMPKDFLLPPFPIQLLNEPTHVPFWIVLSHVTDAHNIGSIIRTAHFLGADGIIMDMTSSTLTATTVSVSCGATEHIPIYMSNSESLIYLAQLSVENGWRVVCAVAPSDKSISLRDFEKKQLAVPTILILGSEEKGIDQEILASSDCHVTIDAGSPSSSVDSLNVGVATGILVRAIKENIQV